MSTVTYRDGVATIMTRTRKTEVHVQLTADLAVRGELDRPGDTDAKALAAGYLHLEAENKALRAELEAARAGTIGREHAEAMHGARKVIAELCQAGEAFFEEYDKGDGPDGVALRGAMGAADTWLLCDVSAARGRAQMLKGGAA